MSSVDIRWMPPGNPRGHRVVRVEMMQCSDGHEPVIYTALVRHEGGARVASGTCPVCAAKEVNDE